MTSPTAGFGDAINVNFSAASGAAADPGESILFGSATEAQFIRFDINSNHGGDHTGISEVRFFAGQVPEPSSATLLLTIGMVAWTRRRRPRRQG